MCNALFNARAKFWPRVTGSWKGPGAQSSKRGADPCGASAGIGLLGHGDGVKKKERKGPGFPPDVWRAHMIDGICLSLY